MFATVLTIRDVKFHRVGAFLGNLEQPADSRKDVLFVDFEKNVANPESDAKNHKLILKIVALHVLI